MKIVVERAFKGIKNEIILDSLDLKVQEACIYALCGASGCGKTTLLKSIVGRISLDSGQVSISSSESQQIGFMPQEVALFQDLTVFENLKFFSLLYNLKEEFFCSRLKLLAEIFQILSLKSKVQNLSGGEQRRVSLMISLLHEPDVLILDEPTVGFDIELKVKVWAYLKELSRVHKTTILISTHDMNEAEKADFIGYLHSGKILVENSTKNLMEELQVETLEEVFQIVLANEKKRVKIIDPTVQQISPKIRPPKQKRTFNAKNVKALMWKNLVKMKTYYIFSLSILILPVLQFILFNLAIGSFPSDFKIGIVNHEIYRQNQSPNCSYENLSYRFLQLLENSTNFTLITVNDDSGFKNKTLDAIMTFPGNFSEGLSIFFKIGKKMKKLKQSVSQLVIEVQPDTHMYVKQTFKSKIENAFDSFSSNVSCDKKSLENINPIKFEKPIYGREKISDFLKCSTPVNYLVSIFFAAILSICTNMTESKECGALERCLTMKVSKAEYLFANFVTQFSFVFIQIFGIFLLSLAHSENLQDENLSLTFTFFCLAGICGVLFGAMLSIVGKNDVTISAMIFGVYYILLFLSPFFSTTEAMSKYLQPIAELLPLKKPMDSLVFLTQHPAVSFLHPKVFGGFILQLGWIFGLLVLLIFYTLY